MFQEIDIHGLTCAEAKKVITQRIASCPKGCELRVIHGFHGGQALQKMVRNELKHPRIKSKLIGLNNGETILLLN